ncbi:MAG: hypothetical protein ACKO0Z_18035 [Betaproteobacteria bacterium]
MIKKFIPAIVVAMLPLVVSSAAHAATPFNFNRQFAVTADLEPTAYCDNSSVNLTFSGTVTLDIEGVVLNVVAANNSKGTKYLDYQGQITLTAPEISSGYQINKQPSIGGAGGNPYIGFGLEGTSPVYLGRCVLSSNASLAHYFQRGPGLQNLAANFSAQSCSTDSQGTNKININVGHGTNSAGGNVTLANNMKGTLSTKTSLVAGISLVPNQQASSSHGLSAIGGNPMIYAQWLKCDPRDDKKLCAKAATSVWMQRDVGDSDGLELADVDPDGHGSYLAKDEASGTFSLGSRYQNGNRATPYNLKGADTGITPSYLNRCNKL